jgi:hypothetical protein
VNHDAKRATGAGGERHAIGVTSMCLRSGSVQLPYALSGRLPEGELLVHDVESDEALVLWSEPPRRLAGLGPLFERHEVQVNDQLVLDLHGDEVRLAVAKRPRRSRPKVTPSAWSSHRDEPPRRTVPASTEDPVADPGGGESPPGTVAPEGVPADRDAAGRSSQNAPAGRPTGRHGGRAPRPSEPPEPEPAADETPPLVDDVPRAPRVRVKPLAPDAGAPDVEPGEPASAEAPRPQRRGALGGLLRAARGWLGGAADRRRQGREPSPADADDDEPDWTRAWQGTEEDVGGAEEAAFDAATYGEPEPELDPLRGPPRGAGIDDASKDSPTGPVVPRERPEAAERRPRPDRTKPVDDARTPEPRIAEPRRPTPVQEAEAPETPVPETAVPETTARAQGSAAAHDATHASETREPRRPASETSDADDETAADGPTLPSGVPIRAERFLGGDLRTRLLRFLASRDMPLIAKTELIAKRFDLDLDTARDMLEDVADDPPDGLRLTPVRDGAWRIERTGS